MPNNAPALAWLRTQAEGEDTTAAGHARAVLEMVEGLEGERDRTFHSGMLAAMHLVFVHDQETIYMEIVNTASVSGLVAACEDESEARMLGLFKYKVVSPAKFRRMKQAPAPSHQRGVLGRRP